jgi:hypothetical protein
MASNQDKKKPNQDMPKDSYKDKQYNPGQKKPSDQEKSR